MWICSMLRYVMTSRCGSLHIALHKVVCDASRLCRARLRCFMSVCMVRMSPETPTLTPCEGMCVQSHATRCLVRISVALCDIRPLFSYTSCVDVLVEMGADPCARDLQDYSILHHLAVSWRHEILEVSLQRSPLLSVCVGSFGSLLLCQFRRFYCTRLEILIIE